MGDGPTRSANGISESAALAQLRAYIAESALGGGDRLPSEKALCEALGLRRFELRKALSALEAEGVLWRHTGKGTFLTDPASRSSQSDLSQLAKRLSPADVMRARAALEPAIARDAALHASAAQLATLRITAERARRAASWREYEALDNEFHHRIAEGTGSTALLALFDQLNTLRRMVSWGRTQRPGARPPETHSSFAEHDRILAALTDRDPEAAQNAMRLHLRSVEDRLFS